MTFPRALLVWLLLMTMLAAELGLSFVPAAQPVVPLVGIVMAAIVALTFMRLGTVRGLPAVFAVAGLFWLAVLLGLGSLDSFTRHDVPAAFR